MQNVPNAIKAAANSVAEALIKAEKAYGDSHEALIRSGPGGAPAMGGVAPAKMLAAPPLIAPVDNAFQSVNNKFQLATTSITTTKASKTFVNDTLKYFHDHFAGMMTYISEYEEKNGNGSFAKYANMTTDEFERFTNFSDQYFREIESLNKQRCNNSYSTLPLINTTSTITTQKCNNGYSTLELAGVATGVAVIAAAVSAGITWYCSKRKYEAVSTEVELGDAERKNQVIRYDQ